MGKFDGMLFCTDLDGTLLKNDGTISAENTAAIEYFKSEGGLFTFVTGRMPFFAYEMYKAVKPNAPVGCINGGALYDYEKREYIGAFEMPENVNELLACIDKRYPNVGIQVNTYDTIYFCKENIVMEAFRKITGVENKVKAYDEVSEPVAKIVFGCESEEEIEGVENTLKSHPLSDSFDFIRSEKTLFEILPKGTGKGAALLKLARYLNISEDKTVAIGDYNNDVSMLRAAKVGVAVKNACPEALSAADLVTVSNEEHAVAKVICDIDEGRIIL